jgi:hypothetical protein
MQTFIAVYTLSQLATDAYETHVVKFKTTSMLNFLMKLFTLEPLLN